MDVLSKLSPYLTGEVNQKSGEWGLRCPMPDHPDRKRSASVNFEKDAWFCQRCRIGGSVEDLLSRIGQNKAAEKRIQKVVPISQEDVDRYHKWLMKDKQLIRALQRKRGLSVATLTQYQIGYEHKTRRYTIPIYNEDGMLVNIRRYDPAATGGDKMISVMGHGRPWLYPMQSLRQRGEIIICEGELDALTLLQHGFNAITRTGAAAVWEPDWSEYFVGRDVYLCHDMDVPGQHANDVVAEALLPVAKSVTVIQLPYEVEKNHGKDITDYFWVDEHTAADFKEVMLGQKRLTPKMVSLLDTLAGGEANQVMNTRAMVASMDWDKKIAYSKFVLTCSRDFDEDVCPRCPLNNSGTLEVNIGKHENELIDQIFLSEQEVNKKVVWKSGVFSKCPKYRVAHGQSTTIELVTLREPVSDLERGDVATTNLQRSAILLGKHDTQPSETLLLAGRQYQNPRTKSNEFVVTSIQRADDDLDRFKMTDEMFERIRADIELLDGTPTDKLRYLADDLAANVTRIFARTDMHILMDLVYHSVCDLMIEPGKIDRGRLDVAVVGETRTGKSETAIRLNKFYRLGQLANCENSTFAGLVGGVAQQPNKQWIAKWGVIPINDRRMVILDEASGLRQEIMGNFSDVRSRGIASIHKIDNNIEANARTRLLWISNPRHSYNVTGIRMIEDVFGNPEDIARLDAAMSVHSDDPGLEIINDPNKPRDAGTYLLPEDYRTLVMWAWTRQPHHTVWEPGVQDHILTTAIRFGETFTEKPPLVQASSMRMKLARLSAAVAARLFNTDDGERLIVTKAHVNAARDLLLRLYKAPSFHYYMASQATREAERRAYAAYDDTKGWLIGQTLLCTFLKEHNSRLFSPTQLRDRMNDTTGQVGTLFSALLNSGVIEHSGVVNSSTYQLTKFGSKLLQDIPS